MSYIETHEDLRRTREARVMEIIASAFSRPVEVVKPLNRLADICSNVVDLQVLQSRLRRGYGLEIPIHQLLSSRVADVIELVHRRVEDAETEGRG